MLSFQNFLCIFWLELLINYLRLSNSLSNKSLFQDRTNRLHPALWQKKPTAASENGCCRFLALFGTEQVVPAEQEGNAPQPGKPHHRVDNAAEQRSLAPEQPRHKIKLENAHQPPVQAAHNGEDQSQRIHQNPPFPPFPADSIPGFPENMRKSGFAPNGN